MKRFTDEEGRPWVATALEEETPRHHGRWYMVLHPEGGGPELMLPEVRWHNRHTAERTLLTMSDFELRRRLRMASRRHDTPGAGRDDFGQWEKGGPGTSGVVSG